MLYIIIGILMFGVLILLHELGHFLFAKLFKVGINEFSIGMGPKLFSKKRKKDGVIYSLRLLPIGGYVSMVGEDNDGEDAENALYKKPVWQRFIIISAGAIVNILTAFIITAFLVCSSDIYSTKIQRFNFGDEKGNLVEMSSWQGLEIGDEIIEVNGKNIHVRADLVCEAVNLRDEPCTLTVIRDGKEIKIKNFSFPTITDSGITMGTANFFMPTTLKKTPLEVTKQTYFQSFASMKLMWTSLINTVKGEYGMEAVSGPVGIVSEIKETSSYGFSSLMSLVMLISMNLGMMNLLPLPALDGGRLVFLLIEGIRGKPLSPKYEGYVHLAGMVLLFGLMIFVTFNDVIKLIF